MGNSINLAGKIEHAQFTVQDYQCQLLCNIAMCRIPCKVLHAIYCKISCMQYCIVQTGLYRGTNITLFYGLVESKQINQSLNKRYKQRQIFRPKYNSLNFKIQTNNLAYNEQKNATVT